MNIVTLLPSATEIVRSLGLDDKIVGISHSCRASSLNTQQAIVTSTSVPYQDDSETIDQFVRNYLQGAEALYSLDLEALNRLAPDFIISQNLCDVCAVSTPDLTTALTTIAGAPEVVNLEPNILRDVFDDCLRVGQALGVSSIATELVQSLSKRRDAVANVSATIADKKKPRVAFLEWLMPPFNAGHWTPELITLAGGVDILGNPGKPSFSLSWPDVFSTKPDVIFIGCCGFTAERSLTDIHLLSQEPENTEAWAQSPDVKIIIIDGDYFSCPGPRLIDGLEIMANALHPNQHDRVHSVACHEARLGDFI